MKIQVTVKLNPNGDSALKAWAAVRMTEGEESQPLLELRYLQIHETKGLVSLQYPSLKTPTRDVPTVVILNKYFREKIERAVTKEYLRQSSSTLYKNLLFEEDNTAQ